MQTTLRGLNVNLSSLVQKIIQFFESEEFSNVTAFETERGYEIVAKDSKHYKMSNGASVTIEGRPDEFTVTMASTKKDKGPAIPLMLAHMFGGGYFALKEIHSDEAMRKLEEKFKMKMNSMIEQSQQTPETSPKNAKDF